MQQLFAVNSHFSFFFLTLYFVVICNASGELFPLGLRMCLSMFDAKFPGGKSNLQTIAVTEIFVCAAALKTKVHCYENVFCRKCKLRRFCLKSQDFNQLSYIQLLSETESETVWT